MYNFVHKGQPPVVIRYGLFLQQIIHLLVLAFALFGIVKLISRLRRIAAQNQLTTSNQPTEPSEEIKLLQNIRDLLVEIKNTNISHLNQSTNLINL